MSQSPLSNILIENVLQIAEKEPRKIIAKFLSPGQSPISLTYSSLIEASLRVAHSFQESGVKKGDVVILLVNHSPELLYAFIGSMLIGAVPSIFSTPSAKISSGSYRRALTSLLALYKTNFLVADAALEEELEIQNANSSIVLLKANAYSSFTPTISRPTFAPSDIAILQHSSGTTGLKKGVALTHQNILHQLRHYASALRLSSGDKIVSWLPLYHDMGLVACFILPLVYGIPLVLMSPYDWVVRPGLLFEAIEAEQGTLCWQPNFAYNFLAQNIALADFNPTTLSSMRAFINCSEPISAKSHHLFYETFHPLGLKRESLCTCYAMAENTFAVTQGGIHAPVKTERLNQRLFTMKQQAVAAQPGDAVKEVVSSGQLLPNNHVRITNPDHADVKDRVIGEIAIKSDSMLSGYYMRPDFIDEMLKKGWYFTGDLGYIAENELFVTGRKKDMIISAGKNIYPQDVEEIVSLVNGIYPGRVACFGLYNEDLGTEDIIVLAETKEEDDTQRLTMKLTITKDMREGLDCIAHDIVLLPHMSLLKSSSGKIARGSNKERYLSEWK